MTMEPRWISATDAQPGYVVENPYSPGRILELDSVQRFGGLVLGSGWLTDTKTGAERRVDAAQWLPFTALRLLDDLRDVKQV